MKLLEDLIKVFAIFKIFQIIVELFGYYKYCKQLDEQSKIEHAEIDARILECYETEYATIMGYDGRDFFEKFENYKIDMTKKLKGNSDGYGVRTDSEVKEVIDFGYECYQFLKSKGKI